MLENDENLLRGLFMNLRHIRKAGFGWRDLEKAYVSGKMCSFLKNAYIAEPNLQFEGYNLLKWGSDNAKRLFPEDE
jgi:hypothetical protein